MRDFLKLLGVRKLSQEELSRAVSLSGGVAVLIALVMVLTGIFPGMTGNAKLALNRTSDLSAAVDASGNMVPLWETQEPSYDGGCKFSTAQGTFSSCGKAWNGYPSPPSFKSLQSGEGSGACYPSGYQDCTTQQCLDAVNGGGGLKGIVGVISTETGSGIGSTGYVQNNGTTGTWGATPSVPSGNSVAVAWACQGSQSDAHAAAGANDVCTTGQGDTYTFAKSVIITGPNGTVYSGGNLTGSILVPVSGQPWTTQNFSLTCVGTSKQWVTNTNIELSSASLSIAADSSNLSSGQSTTVRWQANDVQANSCKVTGPSGFATWSDTSTYTNAAYCYGASAYGACSGATTKLGDQTYTVPAGITHLFVKLWGAGGATNAGIDNYGGPGGFTRGLLTVNAGDTLKVIVGQGGVRTAGGDVPGGGRSEICSSTDALGNGLCPSGTDLLIAGGGGGAPSSQVTLQVGAEGGAGGGTTGLDAVAGSGSPGAPGTGGTATAGGVGGSGTQAGASGSQFNGGSNSAAPKNWYGGGGDGTKAGGGGGGYFGGGAGGSSNGAGGGGSAYISNAAQYGVTSAGTMGQTGKAPLPPNTNDPYYVKNVVGIGGYSGGSAAGLSGGNGYVYIVPAVAVSNSASTGPLSSDSTYTITCTDLDGSTVADSTTVTVGGAVEAPTADITGNGQEDSITVDPGEAVDIEAAFTVDTADGDTALNTAINDFQNSALTSWQPPTDKSYTFNDSSNPAAPGTYVFYPAIQTQSYGWNNYGASLTVVVAASSCANGLDATQYPSCTCPNGQVQSGSSCVAGCSDPHASTGVPPTCNCDPGYSKDSNDVCVATQCSDPHANQGDYPTCSCDPGYSKVSGVCTLTPPTMSLKAMNSRVRKGNTASLTWSVAGLVAGAGESCAITSFPAGVFASTMPANTAPTWGPFTQTTGPIVSTTVFTLSCTGASPISTTVGILPTIIEQ